MKRGPFLGVSSAGCPKRHQFPRGTLLVSICLLVGGMRLADVLPTPSLPRLAPAPVAQAAVASDDGLRFLPLAAAPIPVSAAPLPGARSPAERITATDVMFQPIQVPMGDLASRIRVTADKGQVVLTDARNRNILWSGPVASARFVYSDVAANRVLKDSLGRILWSENSAPDLCLRREADGRTRLCDRKGQTLWEGNLSPSPLAASQPSRSEHRRTTYAVDFAGIKVRGINGYFTFMDDTGRDTRILWSGTVSGQPTLLLQDQHRFFYWDDRGPMESSDRLTTIELREESGQVTIIDPPVRIVGRQTIPLLTVTSAIHLIGQERTIPVPCQYYVPLANLAKPGCVLFSYQNKIGNVVLTNSVVRNGEQQRINNNNGQPL